MTLSQQFFLMSSSGSLPSNGILMDNADPKVSSIDWFNRLLVSDAGVTTVNWNSRLLYSGIDQALDWGNRLLQNASEADVLDWSTHACVKIAGSSGKSALSLTGAILTGQSGTNNLPHVLIQPSGATPATSWSASGTMFGGNALSGFAGKFFDFRKDGGPSLAALDSGGNFSCAQILDSTGLGMRYDFFYNGVQCSNTDGLGISWSNSVAASSSKHVGLFGYASELGVVQVNSTTKGTYRDLRCRSVLQVLPASITPSVNNEMVFEATSNTSVTMKLKGSDAVVRTIVFTVS